MDDILDHAARQMYENKMEEAKTRLAALEEELGVVFQPQLHFSPTGVVTYLAVLANEPNTEAKGDSEKPDEVQGS